MTHHLVDFAKVVTADATHADNLRKAIDFLEAACGADAVGHIEVYWARYLLDGPLKSYPASSFVEAHVNKAWSEIHHAVLTRAKEDLAAIERRYEPLLGGS
jgi:hypothetical protein